LTPDEAIRRIQQVRPVANFAHQGFWKAAGGEALVTLARDILEQPPTIPKGLSPFLDQGWRISNLLPPGDVTKAPYIGLDVDAGWRTVPVMYEFVDVHDLCGLDGIVYLTRKVRTAEHSEWILHVGHDGGVRVFVDGQPVACEGETLKPAPFLRTQARVDWTAGEHEIVVALNRAGGAGWGIFVSFEPAEAQHVPGRKTVFPI